PLLYRFPRLMGQTLGLVAFGHVARGVATRAKPFGLRVIAYDPFVEELTMSRYGVEPVSLPELLAQADIVSMHAPSTPSAQHMLREEHFRAMKRTALFVNPGRGPTADELGLAYAIVHANATPVWPPTGIALAAVLLLGRGIWPAIFAGAFAVNLTTAGSVLSSLGIAAGNTLEALVGAFLVERFAGGVAVF